MYAAYETLPQGIRRRIDGLAMKRDPLFTGRGVLRDGVTPGGRFDVIRAPGPSHPVVRRPCASSMLGRTMKAVSHQSIEPGSSAANSSSCRRVSRAELRTTPARPSAVSRMDIFCIVYGLRSMAP